MKRFIEKMKECFPEASVDILKDVDLFDRSMKELKRQLDIDTVMENLDTIKRDQFKVLYYEQDPIARKFFEAVVGLTILQHHMTKGEVDIIPSDNKIGTEI